jgi:branched-chain amino acid aminotransferase
MLSSDYPLVILTGTHVAMSAATPLVYLNGRFLPQSEAHLPLHDAGFVMGATVTDLCRTFRHRLFRLPDHLHRFRQSCQIAQIPQLLPDDELTRLAEHLVEHNAALLSPDQDLALVLIATPGPIGYYLGLPGGPGDGPPTLALHTFALPFSRYARLFREGARLVIPSVRQVPAACVDPRIKQRSRLHWWLAEREVHLLNPGASAVLLDANDHLTETAAANVLLVRKGEVLSPPRAGILGGVSLQVTQELCVQLGLPFREQALTSADALAADEIWLCSTPYGIAGVQQLNERTFSWPGPLYLRLRQAWDALVGLAIDRQIFSNR